MKNSSWLLIGFPISLKKSGNSAVVVGLSGEATYHPASGDNVAIQEGSVLPAAGSIELGPGSKVTLFHDGKRHSLDTEGRHDLGQTLKSSGGGMKLKKGFARKFEEQLIMAFGTSGPTGSGSDQDKDDKGDPIGWGSRSIIPITPVDTIVSGEEVLFIWADRKGPSDAVYTFQLFRAGSDTSILQTTLTKKKLRVDLAAFDPKEDEAFYWIVSSGDNQSEKAYFTYSADDKKASKTLHEVRAEEVYQQASETERLLMEAVALKEENFAHQAFEKLQEAASRNPDNRLVEGMMRNFVAQMK